MPELPEVETIRTQLSHYLPLKIKKIATSKVIDGVAHTPLDKLVNLSILEINRSGKMLIFKLSDSSILLSHLGMTGTWLVGHELMPGKHGHLTIFGDKVNLVYDDPRRFGHLYHLNEKDAWLKLQSLGTDLTQMSLEAVKENIQRYPERALKVTLLDQKLFNGSGNYIANEICARAKIKPTRLCKNIKDKEFPLIFKAIHDVLNPALSSGGTTFQGGYRDTSGEKGKGVTHLVVFYQKICQMCKKSKVKKIILGQRGTYYCPHCQK